MDTQTDSARREFPSIVLFVEDDRDTLDMYSTYFEMSGMWVAKSTSPADALKSILELRPDLVVTDLGFRGHQTGADFVHRLKSEPSTQGIPLIVLSGRSTDQIPATTRHEADLCLVKPVLPDALLMDVQRLIALSHTLRDRCARAREKTAQLADPSDASIDRAHELTARSETLQRPCPGCEHGLEWIETGEIAGVVYDYYRWCRQGCGLYCYDRGATKWVKLV